MARPRVRRTDPKTIKVKGKEVTVTHKAQVEALRAKLSKASGGAIAEKPLPAHLALIKKYAEAATNRRKAIRAKCIECSNGSPKEVLECTVKKCALYPFRMGKDPFRAARAAERGGVIPIMDITEEEDEFLDEEPPQAIEEE